MSCNINSNKTDYYIPEASLSEDFDVDQAVLVKARYLSKIPFINYKKESEDVIKVDESYPYTNSYYPYTEDSDALSKVNSLLAEPDILELGREKEAERCSDYTDAYSEREAQIKYLESKPISFVILGKPDIGQQELGKELANYSQCVYIEPQTLIEEEIEAGTRAGECIEFNLRCGRAIGIDIILNLVVQRINSETVKHRGFVLCGLPVIPNDLYEEDPVSSQSAVFTAKDIFEEIYTLTVDFGVAPSHPQVSVSSKYQSDKEDSSVVDEIKYAENISIDIKENAASQVGINYQKQLDMLFSLFEEPFFIIYIQCGTIDVVNKRDNYRFDISSNKVIDFQRRIYNQVFINTFTEEDEMDIFDETFDHVILNSDDFRLKHLVKLPRDFQANVSSQLEHYHYAALNFIQNRILAHNREYFVKVDGRTNVSKMLTILKAKLKIMNIQKVLIPINLVGNELNAFFKTDVTLLAEDMDPSQYSEADKNISPKECFKELRKRQVPNRTYLWSWSEWGTKCPVSMKFGFLREGSVKYPVQFMNKIFFLADQDAYFKFYQNPRPFLLPPFPRLTCRIFIFGPKRSGRSALAHCLAYYLGGTVLSVDKLMQTYMQQRQDEFLEKVRQQAIAEGIALLNQNRAIEANELEQIRIERIKEWVKTVVGLLEEMSNLLDEMEREETKTKFEISSFPMAMKKRQTEVLEDSEYAVGLYNLRGQLEGLNVPIYKLDVSTWKTLIVERRKLLQYLPSDIAQKVQAKPATVFDDFVKEYVAAALANSGLKDLHLSGGGLMELFVKHMKNAEEKYVNQGFARGGWIVDGMLCNLKLIQDFFPNYTGDDIIVLQDSSDFLIDNYKQHKSTFFRDFREFFLTMGLQDAAWRSPSIVSDQLYKEGIAQNILNDILESDDFYNQEEEQNTDLRVEEYKKDIKNFQSDWQSVRQFYLENNLTPIEIDVSGKELPELFTYAIKLLESGYKYAAHQVTEEDRAEEVANFGDQKIEKRSAGEAPSTIQTNTDVIMERVRKYGDTFHFCPVTYSENFVLWKGKEDFAVKCNEKLFLLATETDMQRFINDPWKFLPSSYSIKLPPPRICVIGVTGCGKTGLSKSISENYGLIYLSYETLLKKWFKINTNETLSDLASSATTELRSYLSGKASLPDKFLMRLRPYWFQEPFKSIGFVFDDFPKNHYDIDFMTKNKMIPDMILYPQAEETYLKTKFVDRFLKSWQKEMDKQRQENELRHSKALDKWREQRSLRFNTLIEKKRENRYLQKVEKTQTDSIPPEMRSTSLISFDSVADQEDVDDINKTLDLEFPPIFYDMPTQNEDSFISKTEPLIFNRIQTETATINLIKEKSFEHIIPFVDIQLDLDSMVKTEAACFLAVEPIKFRTKSFLESCYDVSLEVADKLLSSGYMFLSKFGKVCPVQYHQKQIPIQLYQVAEMNDDLFAVIHRTFIYFIIGDKRRKLFKNDPLKYINQDFRLPLINYRISVVGPPKCGKTTLSKRIQKEFGFKLVTRGQAVRYVLKYLFESDLAKNMESVLRKGWELTDEMVVKSVEAATFDGQVISNGVVFDGFPNSLNETRHLAYVDLVPNVIVDLEATQKEVLECSIVDTTSFNFPKFSQGFINHLYEEWLKEASYFREWFDKEYQAMTKIPITASIWAIWHQSKEYFLSTFFEINHYRKHIADDWPLRLGNMLITPLEFIERQSSLKSFCPVCLHFSNNLVSGGEPPDRTGLIQYKQYFYWLCDDHIESFLKNPDIYLPPYSKHGMPTNLPQRTTFESFPENVYEGGVCVTCYKQKRILINGTLTFAATFNEKAYLFDTINCLNTFLRNPEAYLFAIEFRAPIYPDLKYKELPLLGMLEQYLAKYIVQGVSYISKRRPIIAGLDISTSALVGLGLFLKLKNENPDEFKPYFEESFKLYEERRENLLNFLDLMKTYRNPYLYYEESLPKFQLPPASAKSESLTTMVSRIVDRCVDDINLYLQNDNDSTDTLLDEVPVPDDRFDYLCEYFKPVSKVPAFLNIVDIAGLVKGASEGQGLGNAFLSHISACDAIFHLCRAFEDDDVTHIEGEVNPVRDLDIIAEELRLKDEEMLQKHLEKLERTVLRGGDKKQKPDYDALAKVKTTLSDEKKHIRFADWDSKDIEVLNRYLFLTSKPCIYLVNLSEKDYIKKKNKWLIKIKEWVDKNDPGSLIIPFSGTFEHKLIAEYDDPVLRKKYLEDVGATSALDKIIVQGYKALQLEYFFTAGPDEVKAWTIQKGTKAPQAAGRIHTDFEKGFIMAEVMKFQDFKEEGTEAACKAAGKYRQQGRNYVVEDGDIIFFKFNAGAGLKDAKKK